jgi:16S rRNA (guanine1207-N2)-methyltransferase
MPNPGRAGEHYFSAAPGVASERRTIALHRPVLSLELVTDRGVFSGDRVDPGTKLLLAEVPVPEGLGDGDLLDLGCGYGPVALTLARRAPDRTVWAVDVNERARALTAENAATAGVRGRVRVAAPDEVPPDVRFAAIWSNPPIRIGKAALHDLLRTWLGRLAPDGRAWLVVQKHLGSDSLAAWLRTEGHRVERRSSRMGYRILEVAPPS